MLVNLNEHFPAWLDSKSCVRTRLILRGCLVCATYEGNGSYLLKNKDNVVRVDNRMPLTLIALNNSFCVSYHTQSVTEKDADMIQLFQIGTQTKQIRNSPCIQPYLMLCDEFSMVLVTKKMVYLLNMDDFLSDPLEIPVKSEDHGLENSYELQSEGCFLKRNHLLLLWRRHLQLWNLKTATLLVNSVTEEETISFMLAQFERNTLVAVSTKGIHLWNINKQPTLKFFHTEITVVAIKIIEDQLVTGNLLGEIGVYNLEGEFKYSINKVKKKDDDVIISLISKRIVNIIRVGEQICAPTADGKLNIWDMAEKNNNEPTKVIDLKQSLVATSSDSDYVSAMLTTTQPKAVFLWFSKKKILKSEANWIAISTLNLLKKSELRGQKSRRNMKIENTIQNEKELAIQPKEKKKNPDSWTKPFVNGIFLNMIPSPSPKSCNSSPKKIPKPTQGNVRRKSKSVQDLPDNSTVQNSIQKKLHRRNQSDNQSQTSSKDIIKKSY